MRPTKLPRPIPLLAACLLLAASPLTQAQYQWREGGHMVFSDQPPPASVPKANIVRNGAPLPQVSASIDAAATTGKPASGGSGELAGARAGRNGAGGGDGDARTKKAEKAEAERKAADEAVRKADLDKACTASRNQLKGLESGVRSTRYNANGELEYLEDDQRAARIGELKRSLDDSCKG